MCIWECITSAAKLKNNNNNGPTVLSNIFTYYLFIIVWLHLQNLLFSIFFFHKLTWTYSICGVHWIVKNFHLSSDFYKKWYYTKIWKIHVWHNQLLFVTVVWQQKSSHWIKLIYKWFFQSHSNNGQFLNVLILSVEEELHVPNGATTKTSAHTLSMNNMCSLLAHTVSSVSCRRVSVVETPRLSKYIIQHVLYWIFPSCFIWGICGIILYMFDGPSPKKCHLKRK